MTHTPSVCELDTVEGTDFVKKLWHLIHSPVAEGIVQWENNGKSFIITDEEVFMKQVVPVYYKMNVYTSFTRQCNAHGFQITNNHTFTNPNFRQDDPKSLSKIVSKKKRNRQLQQQQQQHRQQQQQPSGSTATTLTPASAAAADPTNGGNGSAAAARSFVDAADGGNSAAGAAAATAAPSRSMSASPPPPRSVKLDQLLSAATSASATSTSNNAAHAHLSGHLGAGTGTVSALPSSESNRSSSRANDRVAFYSATSPGRSLDDMIARMSKMQRQTPNASPTSASRQQHHQAITTASFSPPSLGAVHPDAQSLVRIQRSLGALDPTLVAVPSRSRMSSASPPHGRKRQREQGGKSPELPRSELTPRGSYTRRDTRGGQAAVSPRSAALFPISDSNVSPRAAIRDGNDSRVSKRPRRGESQLAQAPLLDGKLQRSVPTLPPTPRGSTAIANIAHPTVLPAHILSPRAAASTPSNVSNTRANEMQSITQHMPLRTYPFLWSPSASSAALSPATFEQQKHLQMAAAAVAAQAQARAAAEAGAGGGAAASMPAFNTGTLPVTNGIVPFATVLPYSSLAAAQAAAAAGGVGASGSGALRFSVLPMHRGGAGSAGPRSAPGTPTPTAANSGGGAGESDADILARLRERHSASLLAREPKMWSERDVSTWLEGQFTFGREYKDIFFKEGVDGRMLFDLTESMLRNDLSVASRVHMTRFLRDIEDLRRIYNYGPPAQLVKSPSRRQVVDDDADGEEELRHHRRESDRRSPRNGVQCDRGPSASPRLLPHLGGGQSVGDTSPRRAASPSPTSSLVSRDVSVTSVSGRNDERSGNSERKVSRSASTVSAFSTSSSRTCSPRVTTPPLMSTPPSSISLTFPAALGAAVSRKRSRSPSPSSAANYISAAAYSKFTSQLHSMTQSPATSPRRRNSEHIGNSGGDNNTGGNSNAGGSTALPPPPGATPPSEVDHHQNTPMNLASAGAVGDDAVARSKPNREGKIQLRSGIATYGRDVQTRNVSALPPGTRHRGLPSLSSVDERGTSVPSVTRQYVASSSTGARQQGRSLISPPFPLPLPLNLTRSISATSSSSTLENQPTTSTSSSSTTPSHSHSRSPDARQAKRRRRMLNDQVLDNVEPPSPSSMPSSQPREAAAAPARRPPKLFLRISREAAAELASPRNSHENKENMQRVNSLSTAAAAAAASASSPSSGSEAASGPMERRGSGSFETVTSQHAAATAAREARRREKDSSSRSFHSFGAHTSRSRAGVGGSGSTKLLSPKNSGDALLLLAKASREQRN